LISRPITSACARANSFRISTRPCTRPSCTELAQSDVTEPALLRGVRLLSDTSANLQRLLDSSVSYPCSDVPRRCIKTAHCLLAVIRGQSASGKGLL
jgi:hypothetical protein